jgi:hypothetical protein
MGRHPTTGHEIVMVQNESGGTGTQIEGSSAAGATDSGNPVKVGGKYNSTKPTLTDGQRGDLQMSNRGAAIVTLFGNDSTSAIAARADNADAVAETATANNLGIIGRLTGYNGTTWDRLRTFATGILKVALNSITKTRTALATAVTLTAGAGNTTSSTIDLSAAYGATVNIQLTNGATGPTIAAQVQIQVSNNAAGTIWVNYGGALVGSVTNSAVSSWAVEVPQGFGAVRIVSGSNTAQNVTLDADISVVSAL